MSPSLVWLVTLPLAVLFTFILVARIIRRSVSKRNMRVGSDFEIDQLFKLMSEGQLSAEEVERAKLSVLSRKKSAVEHSATPARAFEVQPIQSPGSDSAEKSD